MALKKIDPKDLANWILLRVDDVNHLKLQKLLYFCQAWHLAIFEQPLIDDDFEAWVHGPVSRKIWNKFRGYSVLYTTIDKPNDTKLVNSVESVLAKDQIQLLNDVLLEYGDKTSYDLERLTHADKPWVKTRGGLSIDEKSEKIISKELIKETYLGYLGNV